MKTVLFDLDGTLIDSTEAILEGFEVSFRSFNKTPPKPQDVKKLIGLPLDVMFENLGAEKEKVWDYVDTYKHLQTALPKNLKTENGFTSVCERSRY